MISPAELTSLIETGLPGATVQVQDLTGGGDHYQAVVVSDAFIGKRRLQQHQLVYGTVGAAMASDQIHALALQTYTPEEWADLGSTTPPALA
jgi:acid stress-induced BolA-like protein IbaG/YrbA